MKCLGRLAAAVCLLPLFVGCSRSDTPATAKVTGLVTYKGTPVDGATVVFSPSAGGRPATAITDAQGRYQLTTYGDKDGAVPGTYNVAVIKMVGEGNVPKLSSDEIFELQRQGKQVPVPQSKNVLPEKYATSKTSDLNVTVKTADNDIPLELKD